MVFSSLFFLFLFLPLNLIIYYSTKNKDLRNLILIFFSLIFYAWGEPIWFVLLVICAIVDYFNGIFICNNQGKSIAKLGVISTFVFNIGLLLTFKYSDFFVENANFIFGTTFKKPGFLLPVGISFYTFQTISYTIDVYRGEVKAQKSFLKFLFASFGDAMAPWPGFCHRLHFFGEWLGAYKNAQWCCGRIDYTSSIVQSCLPSVNARLMLSAHMLFRAVQQTNLHSPLTDILSSTSSGMWNITSNPQHYHSGGGSSSRWVDNAGQSVSHCRTVLRTYVYFHSHHRLCCSEKDSISLNILLLTSHGSVDESWMGAPFDLAGVDERAPISKILPHDMWQE